MFLSCVAVRRGGEAAKVTLRMEVSPHETVTITAGTSEVLGITDSAPGEIAVYQGEDKLGKLFIDLTEFEFSRPVGGIFVFDKAVMRLRRPVQLLTAREFAANSKTTKPPSLVLTLVLMRLAGDPRRDSVRVLRAFAEKLALDNSPALAKSVKSVVAPPSEASAASKSVGLNDRPAVLQQTAVESGDKENADPRTLRRALEQKDAEIEDLRREISKLRQRVEGRLHQSPLKLVE